jgi:hypothetical protein
MGMISNVCVPFLKTLYPSRDIASAHAGISTCTLHVQFEHEYPMRVFPPSEEILSLHVAKMTCPLQPFSRIEI